MAWCFSTRASVATVLTTHPCVSRCLRVKLTPSHHPTLTSFQTFQKLSSSLLQLESLGIQGNCQEKTHNIQLGCVDMFQKQFTKCGQQLVSNHVKPAGDNAVVFQQKASWSTGLTKFMYKVVMLLLIDLSHSTTGCQYCSVLMNNLSPSMDCQYGQH